jgi:hypothetical protein
VAGLGGAVNFNKTGSEDNSLDNKTNKITNLYRKVDKNPCE